MFARKVLEEALPVASVTAVLPWPNVPLAPLAGAVKVTVAPGTGLLAASTTSTVNGLNVALITTDCGEPLTTEIDAAGPCIFVSAKLAEVRPVTDAVTLNAPTVPLAVSAGDCALPRALVVTVAVEPPGKVAVAPVAGAVKTTLTPLTGLPPASVTVATR